MLRDFAKNNISKKIFTFIVVSFYYYYKLVERGVSSFFWEEEENISVFRTHRDTCVCMGEIFFLLCVYVFSFCDRRDGCL